MLKEILKEELQKYGVDWSLEEFQKQIEFAIMNNHKEYIISKITENGLKIFIFEEERFYQTRLELDEFLRLCIQNIFL